MKHIKCNRLVLGAALLGAGMFGVVQPTLADDYDDGEARREDRRGRRDVNRDRDLNRDVNGDGVIDHKDAYIIGQRREHRGSQDDDRDVNDDGVIDHKDAYIIGQRRERSHDYDNDGYDRRDTFRRRQGGVHRDVNRDGVIDHKDAYILGQRGDSRDTRDRSGYTRRGVNTRNNFHTVEGVVVNDLNGNAFVLRTSSGEHLRVHVLGGEPEYISRGDRVRVYGSFSGNGGFRAQNLNLLRNR
jgi:hypothetical protein